MDWQTGFQPTDILPMLLLFLELNLTIPHFLILFRVRLLPREEVKKAFRLTLPEIAVVTSAAIYTQRGLWLAALHAMLHGFYFIFRDHWYSKKVGVQASGLRVDLESTVKITLQFKSSRFSKIRLIYVSCAE